MSIHADSSMDRRAVAEEAAGERIAEDASKIDDLVMDNLGSAGSPLMHEEWCADLLIALRDLTQVFSRLTHGDTLEQATRTLDDAQNFRVLLRAVKTTDEWIAKLIDEAAVDEVDAAEAARRGYRS